jgi:signal transduction histidine kinase
MTLFVQHQRPEPQTSSLQVEKTVSQHPQTIPTPHHWLTHSVSLRVKLLVGFSIVFSLVFAGAFYWFYNFATEKSLNRLRSDMRATLEGAVTGVDVDDLRDLYLEGEPNSAGFSDDPRYLQQLSWFQTVHNIEPRAWLYSYVVAPAQYNRRVGEPTVAPEELEIIYLVDLWSQYDADKAARFLEADPAGMAAHRVYRDRTFFETEDIYHDKWGNWLSASVLLPEGTRANEEYILVLGLDIEADHVFEIQRAIRNRVLIAFGITYGVLFVLIYMLSGVLTRNLSRLTTSAEQIGRGRYGLDLASLHQHWLPDELSTLSQVFEQMVKGIQTRERQISASKQLEYEMRLALEEERELSELKSRFVSMVSHELRTPLTVIRTTLELLDRYGSQLTEAKRQEYFQRSRVAIGTMTQLMEDVLTIGKTEAGRLEFNPVSMDLEEFCAGLVEEIQQGTGINHRLVFTSDGTCKQVDVDPNLMRSVITNLLSNAVKYSAAGSEIKVWVGSPIERPSTSSLSSSLQTSSQAVIEIQDQGIGIPKDDQPKLFELFHRASNVNTIRGTGLGLAIVKQCVLKHKGEVKFKSQQDAGSTFTVFIPLHQDNGTGTFAAGREPDR